MYICNINHTATFEIIIHNHYYLKMFDYYTKINHDSNILHFSYNNCIATLFNRTVIKIKIYSKLMDNTFMKPEIRINLKKKSLKKSLLFLC